MYQLSANIELLFTEAGANHAERVRAAADSGFEFVEIWGHADKDLASLEKALTATGIGLAAMLIEPRAQLGDPAAREGFLTAVARTAEVARRLGCTRIVTSSGIGVPVQKRLPQHRRVVETLKPAAEVAARHGVTIVLENLNTRVDHPGILFDTTTECLNAIREVGSPAVLMLYDLYHSLCMEENMAAVLRDSMGLIAHVQIADVPGRTEPGTGNVDWSTQFHTLQALGYDGLIGLEYFPTVSTVASLGYLRDVLAESLRRGARLAVSRSGLAGWLAWVTARRRGRRRARRWPGRLLRSIPAFRCTAGEGATT